MAAEPAWRFGPVRVWQLPHQPGTRGEPQARVLLADALDTAPERLPLTRDERGRPWLIGALADYGTGWSHSGGHLLVALGEGVRLGVDLERQRPRRQMREVIGRFFHPAEIAWLQGLAAAECEHWFFRVWCAKEALLKAHGHGLSFGLHRLRFAPGEDGALYLAWCDPGLGDAGRWHLHEWQASADFRAALAWYPL
ncbi:4'-phosphopantetheinyl transferase family protein [Stenotrophomonas mori]|uniref:4'-phosphopantetheinyl transferase superfamily protein n=1 Tax=Stenotrophomonas mori TaxID=2871096 RepID=A0ABT0SHA3_9GAMM|nr:4'-phosphopantetheinyl transferase superfamily protein [Stenotrophomonas mori]MCL7714719.1 4'-phosphopantetheinyl transferase superfamily protein [Stenotrophomonas mori]